MRCNMLAAAHVVTWTSNTRLSFVFDVCKQKLLGRSAGRISIKGVPCGSLFKTRQRPWCEHSKCSLVGLKMLFPTVAASPKLLLQLCISTLHRIFCVFSEIFNWTARNGKAPNSPVSSLAAKASQRKIQDATTPTSVNYHFTRKCNYKCGFCFHTAKTSFVLPLEEAKKGLKLLKESGEYINSYTVCSVLVCGVNLFTCS